MEALGMALEGLAVGVSGLVKLIQAISERVAKYTTSKTGSGRAESAKEMTAAQRVASQAAWGVALKGEKEDLSASESAFVDYWSKRYGVDREQAISEIQGLATTSNDKKVNEARMRGAAIDYAQRKPETIATTARVDEITNTIRQAEQQAKKALDESDLDGIKKAVKDGAKEGTSQAKLTAPTPLSTPQGDSGTPVHKAS
jgi:hypothetical protein